MDYANRFIAITSEKECTTISNRNIDQYIFQLASINPDRIARHVGALRK